jgi:FtsZ-interacting cell division protein ZipA
MDSEKIIFIILALVFSIFSMFMKSKKQKRSFPEKEQTDTDFPHELDPFTILNSDPIFEQSNVEHVQENYEFYPKKGKKKQKPQNIEKENSQIENSQKNLQNIDLESEISLLEDFEGSELQKAFVLSEIFKNANN